MGKEPGLRDCACRNLRMTTRVITQYYDAALRPAGLSAAQFALLAAVSAVGGRTIGELAEAQLMDQTTATRSIELLKKNGYLEARTGEVDSRKRHIWITGLGTETLRKAIPFWEQAQRTIEQGLGTEKYEDFLTTLAELQRII
ncbi:winged helix-turn-helix transcriptional regulator [Anoxybacterium hadale]|uniref:Winged helix-turn-helix transcriptional regulator n=1 Tax=Anoxybacterium hadale TaxID=3408580 RepID=A0ACD1A6R0_9FIRM|nr:winged helix-turn-helix transcriptional regulator [Clostridiales bacterium]